MTTPKFRAVFPCRFPCWNSPDDTLVDGMYPTAMGISMSWRFVPRDVAATDYEGRIWVLVDDYAIKDSERKRWVLFPSQVGD